MNTTLTVPNKVPEYVVTDVPQANYWVRGIPAPLVETFWHYAVPYIKRALDHASGEFEHTDLRKFCQERDMQLWLIARPGRVVGAGTTEIVVYPRRKHLRIVTLSGSEFEQWMPIADVAMEEFARANGCHALECYARRGFAKRLDGIGYRLRHCALFKPLGDPS